jgi:hypothetical protein
MQEQRKAVIRIRDICTDPDLRTPYLWLTEPHPDPDPALFVTDLQDADKSFFSYYFLKEHLHHSSKIKSHKEVPKK